MLTYFLSVMMTQWSSRRSVKVGCSVTGAGGRVVQNSVQTGVGWSVQEEIDVMEKEEKEESSGDVVTLLLPSLVSFLRRHCRYLMNAIS
mmetsp:Transcript_1958/g.4484  ORF Transcript_1958/g.4484 Transcript_1958/m.4484 type:complete len:89 (-) Transcript_1958:254-520(-)